jgi:hypothetical protein
LDVLLIGGAVLAILYAPQLGWTNPSIITMFNNGEPFIGPAERGSGNIITETRQVSNFHSIDISYPAQVLVKQGSQESLQIEADDNFLPGLQTQVRNNTLEIFYKTKDGKHVNPTKGVNITVVVKDLTNVDFTSAGELTVDNLKTNALDVSLSGAGNLKLNKITVKNLSVNLSGAGGMSASGTADNLNLSISGFGDFKGADLHSKDAQVDISGAGSATVWADNNLNAQISGAGSVSYYGSASVTKQISGVGGVNHLGSK